jgi:hypothetical protein
MVDKRRSCRVKPEGLGARTGKILLGGDSPPIECRVVDISTGERVSNCRWCPACRTDLNSCTVDCERFAKLRGPEVFASAFNMKRLSNEPYPAVI